MGDAIFAPGLLNATVDVTSESVIESYDVPVLFGRRVLHDKVRVFIGPTLLFVNKSEATRNTQGQINPNTAIGFDNGFGKGTPIPATSETTNLLSPREATNLQVKRFTWALEAGVGISPLPFLDIRPALCRTGRGCLQRHQHQGISGHRHANGRSQDSIRLVYKARHSASSF